MHGGYREDERTRLEYYVVGELLMQFKRYLPALVRNVLMSNRDLSSYGRWKYRGSDNKLLTNAKGEVVMKWVAENMEGR